MSSTLNVFDHLNFLLIDEGATDDNMIKTAALLKENGAAECSIISVLELQDAKEHTKAAFTRQFEQDIHCIISNTCNFWFYRLAAFDFLIPVVSAAWVQACISTKRITRASCFSPDPAHILKHCQIYVSRHSLNPSEYALYSAMITSLGGVCIDYLSSRASHIITVDPQDPAIAAVANIAGLSIKYVLPTWIAAVFKSKTYTTESEHLLDPRERPEAMKSKMSELWNKVELQEFTSHSHYLTGHKIFLSLDLILPAQCYSFLIDVIKSAGGEVVRHVDSQDVSKNVGDCFVSQSTKSQEYDKATAEHLYKGNISWIFYMWSMQQFIEPEQKLLLSPLKPRIFKGNELILSYTNYVGQQRSYVQKLVDALGGISTTELTRKNTHLLSCMPFGQKYQAALRWKDTCRIVNHFWLEECYKRGQKLDCTLEQFSTIEAFNGLTERLGQLSLTDQVYEPELSKGSPEGMNGSDGGTNPDEKESSTARIPDIFENNDDSLDETNYASGPSQDKDKDIEFVQKSNDDKQREKLLDVSNGTDPLMGEAVEIETANDDTQLKDKKSQSLLPGQPSEIESVQLTSAASITTAEEHSDELSQMQDTTTPSPAPTISSQLMSSGTRQAKKKAAMKLHTDMESLNEFQRYSKRKKTSGLLPEELQKLKKLKEMEDKLKELLENVGIDISKGRRNRPYNINAICTGCHEQIDDLDMEILKRLGITITEEITPQTNTIIAPKRMRTAKFLISLSFNPLKYALLPTFITDLLTTVRKASSSPVLPETARYIIPDVHPEILEKTHLKTKVFERADITNINLMDDIPGGPEVISSILVAHGIKKVNVLSKKFEFTDVIANDKSNGKGGPNYLLIAQKASQAKKFSKICQKKDRTVTVVEWNWCVRSIFNLDANFEDGQYVIYRKSF